MNEVIENPSLADVIKRLRAQARYSALSNNFQREQQPWRPEHFQSWHDAKAIEGCVDGECGRDEK